MGTGTIVVIVVATLVLVAVVVLALRRRGVAARPPELGAGDAADTDASKTGARALEAATRAAPAAPPGASARQAAADARSLPPDAATEAASRDHAEAAAPASPPARDVDATAAAAVSSPAQAPSAMRAAPEAAASEAPPGPAPAPAPAPSPPAAAARRRAGADDVAALKKGLASTRGGFIARLARMLGRGRRELEPALLEQMEEVLLTADLGPKTTAHLLDRLRERAARGEVPEGDGIWDALREEARALLGDRGGPIVPVRKPTVVLVIGVNGVGKTTTIGKLASRYHQEGKKVILAAGDTFRAAAVLQLEVWARRVGCGFVRGKDNADPGAVIFDAIRKAQAEGADVVLADTAGRLHTKVPLMEELGKVGRTVEKALERPADEVILVLDATSGQNALQQAQMFKEALPITGVVLTKLDGTAKGGVILGIALEHAIPVRYVGIGERVEDLREFDAEAFVDALFERPEEDTAAA
jgi:fused signal recognition particle receptor